MALSKEQKLMIIDKYKLNWTIKQISENMKINKSTVHLWIKRYKQNESLERKPGSGIRIIDQNKQ